MNIQTLFDMLQVWPMAKANYRALDSVLMREVCESPRIYAMCNPERVRSTVARVDHSTIASRPCFLCEANRPTEQTSLPWRDYSVLVNPYPIFRRHLTIVSRTHCPQDLEGRSADMYALATELPGFSVFFNGPMCGASAPDHFHFQAGDDIFAPSPLQVEVDNGPQNIIYESEELGTVSASDCSGRLVYHAVSHSEQGTPRLLSHLFAIRWLRKDMMNIIAKCRDDDHSIVDFYIIPRRIFRPWQYTAPEDEKILISPAAVEVAGIYVLPRREDYDRMTPELAKDIMRQSCFASDEVLFRDYEQTNN